MYSEFSEAVKKARAEAEGAHIRNIKESVDNGTWQASAWFLERSFPQKWANAQPWTSETRMRLYNSK